MVCDFQSKRSVTMPPYIMALRDAHWSIYRLATPRHTDNAPAHYVWIADVIGQQEARDILDRLLEETDG